MTAVLGSMLLSLFLLIAPERAAAQVDVYEFETQEQEQRFRQLSNEFRCPMCQNANLSSSPGGVAADLRREIYRMIIEGQTDAQIEEFMLSRYGDFVLYRPRLTVQTILLWFGPFLFLALGGWVTFSIIRRSSNMGVAGVSANLDGGDKKDNLPADETTEITASERARLNRLLASVSSDSNADNSDR